MLSVEQREQFQSLREWCCLFSFNKEIWGERLPKSEKKLALRGKRKGTIHSLYFLLLAKYIAGCHSPTKFLDQ